MRVGRAKRIGAVASVAVAVLASLAPLGATAADNEVRTARVWQPEGRPPGVSRLLLAVDPARRLLYGIAANGAWLGLYDLDTLALRSSLSLTATAPTVVSVDRMTGDLFVTTSAGAVGGAALARYGLVKGALARRGAVDLRGALGSESQVVGLYRYPHSPLLWVLATSVSTTRPGLKVAEIDIANMDAGGGRVTWVRDVSSECPAPMRATGSIIQAGLGYIPSAGGLYFGCAATMLPDGSQAPENPGVARLLLTGSPAGGPTQPGAFEKFSRPGQFTIADSVVDVLGERVAISASSAAASGVTFYGFDIRTGTWVGGTSAGVSQFASLGLDEVNGRVYGVGQDPAFGLAVIDIRPTPLPQARRYPTYARHEGDIPGRMTMPIDWATGRIFLTYGAGDKFVIVQDDVEPIPDPSFEDPDGNTTDVPESPGRTRTAYSGVAQGFGSRHRWVGGPQNAWYNVTGRTELGPEESRELRGAYLNSLVVANGESSASAIGAERDEHTRRNLAVDPHEATPSVEVAWPYREARCVDFGGRADQDRVDGATVSCDADKELVTASTVFDGTAAEMGAKVGRSEYSARARRDPVRGVVVTVTSVAEDIVVTDAGTEVLRIGEVRVDTEAWARGRPGTAGSTYTRKLKDVFVNGRQQCESTCTQAELDRLGRTALDKLSVTFPEPDPTLAAGSPKGYQALVRRSLPAQLQEVVINGQPPDRVEVPGVVIMLSLDNYFRDRIVVELAAVAAEARYGIALLGSDTIDPEAGGGALVPMAALSDGTGVQSPEGDLVLGASGIAAPTPSDRRRVAAFDPVPISVGRTAGLIWQGLGRGMRLFPVWAVLLAPVYLSARRWLLLERGSLRSGGRS